MQALASAPHFFFFSCFLSSSPAGAAEAGVGLALLAVGAYFTFSIAASLPVLLLARSRSPKVNGEVGS